MAKAAGGTQDLPAQCPQESAPTHGTSLAELTGDTRAGAEMFNKHIECTFFFMVY